VTAAILEIRDGVATGPLHQPVPQIGRNTRFDDEAYNWPALCGVRGHAYQRGALAELGYTTDCFECALVALKPKRPLYNPGPPRDGSTAAWAFGSYATDEERNEARRRSYNSYYQRKRKKAA